MIRNERGIALLEVLIALAILSIGGLAAVAMVDSAVRAQSEMTTRENAVVTASRVMAALSLLKANELTQRIGDHRLGEFTVHVSRPQPALYRVDLSEASAPGQEILVTVVYRP